MRDVHRILGGIMHDTWSNQLSDESFRARSENGYAKHPLLYFAFQWFLGQGMDHKPDLFLKSGDPMVFGHLIEQLRLANGQKVFDEPIVDNLRVGPQPVGGTVFWYPLMMGCLCILGFVPIFTRGRMGRWIYATLLVSSGLVFCMLSILLGYLHLSSQWLEMTGNTLLLLAWPTDIILVWIGIRYGRTGHIAQWFESYLNAHLVVSILLLTLGFLLDVLTGPTWPRVLFVLTWLATLSYLKLHRIESKEAASEAVHVT